jgi:uncharacterized membrane protein
MTRRDEWLHELASSLRGPRHARRRLVSELDAHLADAFDAALTRGLTSEEAEAAVLERLGSASTLAHQWSADASARQWVVRARVLALGLAIAAVLAPVGLAQRGHSQPAHKTPPQAHDPRR